MRNSHSVSSWEATLALEFRRVAAGTVLSRVAHDGPLVVQKPLYPEGSSVCHAIVVHPPGGIAGGDRLALSLDIGQGAHAQLTTPGAAKWYRSTRDLAQQSIEARVGEGGVCEWLPQEAIVFNGARARVATRIALAGDALFLGWDIVCLGRIASGERFEHGEYRHCFELVRDHALVWAERTILDPRDGFMASPVGLDGCSVFGTFVAAAPIIADNALAACRETASMLGERAEGASTRMPELLVARARGDSAETIRRWFVSLWSVLRPALCRRDAVVPRIWST